jgi:hypothetical protein
LAPAVVVGEATAVRPRAATTVDSPTAAITITAERAVAGSTAAVVTEVVAVGEAETRREEFLMPET